MTLSIIVPVYNERQTILEVLRQLEVINFGMESEIIVVDNGSTDGTRELLKSQFTTPNLQTNLKSKIKAIFQKENRGKGAALRRGIQEAKGEIIVIQDADLEYNPKELPKLIQPLLENKSKVVYGSRFLENSRHQYLIFYWGNKLISLLFRIFYRLKITDPMTGYKILKKEILNDFSLKAEGFEIEIELTAKILKAGYQILELPISYQGRTYREGKKIKWFDGLKCLWTFLPIKFSPLC